MDQEPSDPGYDPDLATIIRLAETLLARVTAVRPDWAAVADCARERRLKADDRRSKEDSDGVA